MWTWPPAGQETSMSVFFTGCKEPFDRNAIDEAFQRMHASAADDRIGLVGGADYEKQVDAM